MTVHLLIRKSYLVCPLRLSEELFPCTLDDIFFGGEVASKRQ